jgi:FkbM family methyltransferase
MYTINAAEAINYPKIFGIVFRLFELARLAFTPAKKKACDQSLPYITGAIEKAVTVIDIGAHKQSYVSDLLQLEKLPGRIIAFELNNAAYKYFLRVQKLLQLKNITIEPCLTKRLGAFQCENESCASASTGATVIDFNSKPSEGTQKNPGVETLDHYCSINDIAPGLLKIAIDSDAVNVLEGAIDILEKYKPDILIECAQHRFGRETLLATFSFLSAMKYSGYFILDTMQIPLRNFDFNTFQNEALGFYCNTFYFVSRA